MKKIFLGVLALAIGIFLFTLQVKTPSIPDSPQEIEPPVASKMEEKKSVATGTDPLPPQSQDEITRCLGKPAKDMNALYQLGLEKLGSIRGETLIEKSIFFDDGEKRFHLNLALQVLPSGKEFMELKLFTIDHENLPDLVRISESQRRNPSEEVIQSFLVGKRITNIREIKDLEFDEGIMQVETDNESARNNTFKTIKIETKGMRIACSTNFEASCKCSL